MAATALDIQSWSGHFAMSCLRNLCSVKGKTCAPKHTNEESFLLEAYPLAATALDIQSWSGHFAMSCLRNLCSVKGKTCGPKHSNKVRVFTLGIAMYCLQNPRSYSLMGASMQIFPFKRACSNLTTGRDESLAAANAQSSAVRPREVSFSGSAPSSNRIFMASESGGHLSVMGFGCGFGGIGLGGVLVMVK